MSSLKNMPFAGIVVIVIIILLFALSVILLMHVYNRYRRLRGMVGSGSEKSSSFLLYTLSDYTAAYKQYGEAVNTPAIIDNAVSSKLSGLLFCERFLNNAVSLFVTLGLFGTFLGLSLSVSSLTQLISYSNTSEWLSVLDSVGGGLMSALSGMGVAFYTSLVGVACSIFLTILRSIFSPQASRERLATSIELWLDHDVAPGLPTDAVKDEFTLATNMIKTMNDAAGSMERTLSNATNDFSQTVENSKKILIGFNNTVKTFNEGVHDFSEVDYNLRGTVERMDVSVRDLVGMMQRSTRGHDRRDEQ